MSSPPSSLSLYICPSFWRIQGRVGIRVGCLLLNRTTTEQRGGGELRDAQAGRKNLTRAQPQYWTTTTTTTTTEQRQTRFGCCFFYCYWHSRTHPKCKHIYLYIYKHTHSITIGTIHEDGGLYALLECNPRLVQWQSIPRDNETVHREARSVEMFGSSKSLSHVERQTTTTNQQRPTARKRILLGVEFEWVVCVCVRCLKMMMSVMMTFLTVLKHWQWQTHLPIGSVTLHHFMKMALCGLVS